MRFWTLSDNERAMTGFTHACELTADDFTVTATATLQTFTPGLSFAIGDYVPRVTMYLPTPLQDASDAAFNNDTFSIGDSVGGVATIMAAQQLNVNGTEVLNFTGVPTGTPATGFTAATNLTCTLNSMTAKALNDIDTGKVYFALNVARPVQFFSAVSSGPLLTK